MSDVNTAVYDALLASAVTAAETVKIAGGEVRLRGLTVIEFIQILRKFPKLRPVLMKLVFGTSDDDKIEAELLEVFLDAGPEAIATLIAAAADEKDNADVVRAIMRLSDDDLVALLDRTLDLTMPRGVSDFFGRFKVLGIRLGFLEAPTPQVA